MKKIMQQFLLNRQIFLLLSLLLFIAPIINSLRFIIISNELFPLINLGKFLLIFSYASIFSSFFYFFFLFAYLFYLKKIGHFLKKNDFILKAFSFFCFIIFIVVLVLINLEHNSYPNFLYSKTGNTISFLSFYNKIIFAFLLLSVFVQIKTKKLEKKLTIHSENYLSILIKFIVSTLFFSLVLKGFYPIANFKSIYSDSKLSYHQKLGEEFIAIELLANHIPENETIIHPPQNSTWPLIGNQPMIRYFLYPRKLVSGVLISNQLFANEISSAYFLELSDETKKWPKYDIEKSEVIFNEIDRVKYSNIETVFVKSGLVIKRVTFL